MNKNNDNKLVPIFRFPKFEEDGNWDKKKLGKIGDFTGGGTPSRGNAAFWEGDIPWISSSDIDEDSIYSVRISRFISEEALKISATKIVPANSILLVSRVGVGKLAITYKPICTSQDFTNFTPINHDLIFLAYCLKTHKETLLGFCQGMAIKGFTKDDVSNIVIHIPSISEQHRIATCLSSLDEVITAESQKLDILKDHKKGLLQNLLPQEGETVPKFRFKEFENSGEWVFDAFSEYIKLYRGSSPRPIQNYFTTDESGVNWIKIGDTKNADNFIIKQVEERILPEGAEKSRKVNIGELILANSMSFGRTYQLAIEGFIYDGWFVLREYEKHFDKQFLLQLLNSDYMQTQYKNLSAGGIVQNISSNIVYNTILPHTSINEQQQIASCLSSLDEIISAQTQKVETLKLHKKGLLQGLFPTLNNEE